MFKSEIVSGGIFHTKWLYTTIRCAAVPGSERAYGPHRDKKSTTLLSKNYTTGGIAPTQILVVQDTKPNPKITPHVTPNTTAHAETDIC
eukprot:804447-Rhodomonas_salina.3